MTGNYRIQDQLTTVFVLFVVLVAVNLGYAEDRVPLRVVLNQGESNEEIVYEGVPEDFPLSLLQDNLSISSGEEHSWATFRDLELDDLSLKNIQIYRVDFSGVKIDDFICTNCDILSSSIIGSKISNSEFLNGQLGLTLRNTTVSDLVLRGVRLSSMNSRDSNYDKVKVYHSELSGQHDWRNTDVTDVLLESVSIDSLSALRLNINDSIFMDVQAGDVSLTASVLENNRWENPSVGSLSLEHTTVDQGLQEIANRSNTQSQIARAFAFVVTLGGLLVFLGLPYFVVFTKRDINLARLIPAFLGSGLVLCLGLARSIIVPPGGGAVAQTSSSFAAWSKHADWYQLVLPSSVLFLVLFAVGILAVLSASRAPKYWIFLISYGVVHLPILGYFWLLAPTA